MRKEFPELEEFLWGDSFWADGYFAETVGEANEEVVMKYINTDQESQFTSEDFAERLENAGLRISIGGRGREEQASQAAQGLYKAECSI